MPEWLCCFPVARLKGGNEGEELDLQLRNFGEAVQSRGAFIDNV